MILSMADWIMGTMLWINLNSKKNTDWAKYVRTQRNVDEAFQTYIIHSKKDSTETDTDRWWTYQSNVHGVVVAVNEVPKGTIGAYPRTLGTVVEHFIPGLIVAQSDFEESDHIDIMQFLGSDKKIFLQALRIGFHYLRKNFRSAKKRQENRYAGCSYHLVATALAQCEGIATASDDDEDDDDDPRPTKRINHGHMK